MMQEYRIPMDDGAELFCRIAGRGEPLLMLHGSMVDADFLTDCAEELSTVYRVITYDRRGYSRSTSSKDHSLSRQAQDAAAVLEFFSIGQANIAACSSGGLTALQLAKERPEVIRQMLLYETPATGEEAGEPFASQLKEVLRLVERGKLTKAKFIFMQMLGEPDPEGRPVPDQMVQSNWENGDVFLREEFGEFAVLTAEALCPKAFDIAKITMGIGTESGSTYFACGAKVLAEAMGCSIKEFPGCHNSAYDRPKEFASAVKNILNI